MYTSIVVGTDGSSRSRQAVAHAAGLAKLTGATLHLVHAFRSPSTAAAAVPELAVHVAAEDHHVAEAARALVDALARELHDDGVGDIEVHACDQPAADAICGVAASGAADLIVVGNRGMRGARRVLGSVPNSVAHHAACAVLIVPTA